MLQLAVMLLQLAVKLQLAVMLQRAGVHARENKEPPLIAERGALATAAVARARASLGVVLRVRHLLGAVRFASGSCRSGHSSSTGVTDSDVRPGQWTDDVRVRGPRIAARICTAESEIRISGAARAAVKHDRCFGPSGVIVTLAYLDGAAPGNLSFVCSARGSAGLLSSCVPWLSLSKPIPRVCRRLSPPQE